ncbi:MAG: (d)CMP kinase [Planctomycetota bacterium]
MIITIDGSAGSGKSTAARKLAARLEVAYLDTGAMYRAIALDALQQEVDFSDPDALFQVARNSELNLDCGPTHTRVRLHGHDVSEAIRSMAVSGATSQVAKQQAIRKLMIDHQRRIGAELGSFVTEGRDQGSVVFPHADVKFVMDASLERRAQRRYLELAAEGEEVTLEVVMNNLRSRDQVDWKQWESLLRPGAAIVLDSSDLSIAEVVDRLAVEVQSLVQRETASLHPR